MEKVTEYKTLEDAYNYVTTAVTLFMGLIQLHSNNRHKFDIN